MIQGDLFSASPVAPPRISSQTPLAEGLPSIIDVIAQVSTRPRYAFMVLNLIARAAGQRARQDPTSSGRGRPFGCATGCAIPRSHGSPRS
jgi:hypothetical protein